jgi:hypothetical protein
VTGTGLLELELLNLERQYFIDPFGEALLLGEREREKSRAYDVPMYRIEEGWKYPQVVLAEIGALLFGGIETSDLRGDVMGERGLVDG